MLENAVQHFGTLLVRRSAGLRESGDSLCNLKLVEIAGDAERCAVGDDVDSDKWREHSKKNMLDNLLACVKYRDLVLLKCGCTGFMSSHSKSHLAYV